MGGGEGKGDLSRVFACSGRVLKLKIIKEASEYCFWAGTHNYKFFGMGISLLLFLYYFLEFAM